MYSQKRVKLTDIKGLKNKLPTKLRNTFKDKTTDKLNEAIFDEENISEVIDTLNNANYSFSFILPNAADDVFYEALSWIGLRNTVAWGRHS